MKKIITTIALAFCLQTNAQIITTVAGNGTAAYSGDNGNATAASLHAPHGVTMDGAGNLYITDAQNSRIRKVTPAGTITTIAGNGVSDNTGNGGQATAAAIYNPQDIAVDAAGNLYISDPLFSVIRKINTAGIITIVVGNGNQGYSGDGGQATAAQLHYPTGIAFDATGNLYIVEFVNNVVRKVTPSGIISTVAGNGNQGYSGDGGQATAAQLYAPQKIAVDAAGNLYISDYGNSAVRKVNTAGIITTFAGIGNGTVGYTGDGGQATAAKLNYPDGLTIDASNNLYISDVGNHVIRKINTAGIITTIAGNGNMSFSGDLGQATAASMQYPGGLTLDAYGNLYIADYFDNRIRQVSNFIVNSGAFCAGSSGPNISASGALSYSWAPATGLNTTTGSTVVANPTVTTTYTVMGTVVFNANPIMITSTVTVNPLPVINVNSGAVCMGSSFTMNPTGADTYTYSSGSAIVTPTTNNTYTVTGTSLAGCVSASGAISTVTVNALPVINVNSGTVCAGSSFTMNPTGAITYTYSSGSAIVTPTTNNTYTVTGTDLSGCVSSSGAVSTVTVNALPVINVNSGTVCAGSSFTMNPTGATTYTYSSGSAIVTPTTNNTYTVTGSGLNGCVGETISTVTVNALPIINVNSGSVCAGSSFTMTPTGATTYTYSSSSAIVTPTTNNTYTVTGTDLSGCVSSNGAVSIVTVNALPVINVNSGAICAGSSFTINPTGAITYTYSSGSAIVTPTTNNTYTVTGTDLNGCISASGAVSTITVNALPVINVNSGAVCAGSSFTINPTGANTYTYSSGSAIVMPTTNNTYTVTGTDLNGCISASGVVSTVTVNALPVISVNSGAVCAGSSFTMNPTGANAYTYSSGSAIVTPTTNNTYTVTGSGLNGCVGETVSTVTVNALPDILAISDSSSLCNGHTAVLSASGAATYTWNTNATSVSVSVTPTITTTYSVTGTDNNGCKNTTSVTQIVTNCNTTGISQLKGNSMEISLYPNPANGIINVEIQDAINNCSLQITDMLGNEVYKSGIKTQQSQIDITSLSNGVYILNVEANGTKQTKKFIKN